MYALIFAVSWGESLNCFVVMVHKVRAVTKTWCALKLSIDQFNNHFNSKKAAMEDFKRGAYFISK